MNLCEVTGVPFLIINGAYSAGLREYFEATGLDSCSMSYYCIQLFIVTPKCVLSELRGVGGRRVRHRSLYRTEEKLGEQLGSESVPVVSSRNLLPPPESNRQTPRRMDSPKLQLHRHSEDKHLL